MSNLILVSVQGKPGEKDSVADKTGLTAYLGYRPYFCTKLDPNSLAESWFRLWMASPRYPETINIFIIDESEAIPMNVLDWSNKCLHGKFTPEIFESIKNDHYSLATDYLVKEIPETRIAIEPAALLYSTEIYDYALGSTYEEKERICDMFKLVQDNCIDYAKKMKEKKPKTDDKDILYSILRNSGIVSFLWQVATGCSVTTSLYTITLTDLFSASFTTAENLLLKWDAAIESGEEFTYEDFELMRSEFLKALDIAAKSAAAREAKLNGIGRNDLCSCGSGKKFKHCHATKGIDEMIFVTNCDVTELV